MRIRAKILLLFTLGALTPLLMSHFFAGRMVAVTTRSLIGREIEIAAELAAHRVQDRLTGLIGDVSLVVRTVPFERLTAGDLARVLQLPYRQIRDATIVALLGEDGRALVPPYRGTATDGEPDGREPASEADLEAMSENVPLRLAMTAGTAVGPVYASAGGQPRLTIVESFPVADGAERWALAVEVSLSGVCSIVDDLDHPGERRARLVDDQGRNLCRPADKDGTLESLPHIGRLPDSGTVEILDETGNEILGAAEAIAPTGWRLALERPRSVALAPLSRVALWIVIWVAVSLAAVLGGGLLLARGVSGPIAELERAALRMAEGDYEVKLPSKTRDEVGSLVAAFGRMAAEIRAWNAELKSRVEERTRELREAQQQIAEARRLAAVAELGAGAAHEINNPLTAVIGLAQLLQARAAAGSEEAATLADIVKNARRVADIVDALLRITRSQVAPTMRPSSVGRILEAAVDSFASRLEKAGVAVERSIDRDCLVYADEIDLGNAFGHIVANAIDAMEPGGGRLGLDVRVVEGGAVRVVIEDTGRGMTEDEKRRAFDAFFTTRPAGSGSHGLGLALVQRVIDDHKGRVVLESWPGRGTKVIIYLPQALRTSRD